MHYDTVTRLISIHLASPFLRAQKLSSQWWPPHHDGAVYNNHDTAHLTTMIRFKQALTSVRSHISNFLPAGKTRRASTRADFYYTKPPNSIPSTDSPITSQEAALTLSNASAHSPSPSSRRARPHRLGSWKVPATLAVTKHDASVCKFSHGSGLIVYINGALMTAACVALKVNIATLKVVKKLPLDELGAVGACLVAAFADGRQTVDVAYCEFDEQQEEAWRWAEREWETFPGGPYEYHELSYLYCPIRQMRDECVRLGDNGPVDEDEEWAAFSDRRRTSSQDSAEHIPLRIYSHAGSLSPQCSSASSSDAPEAGAEAPLSKKKAPVMTEAQFDALPDYDESFSSADHDAIELCAIKCPTTLLEPFSDSSSDKENVSQWSPGAGNGPMMSSAEFEALPDYSDVDDDSDWKNAAL